MQSPKQPDISKHEFSILKLFKNTWEISCSRKFFITFLFLLLQFNFGFSQSGLDSLKTSFENSSNDSLKVVQGLQYLRALHRSEHEEETEYALARKIIENALNTGDSLLYARTLDNLGLLYRYHQHYDQALPLHIKAFNLVEHMDIDPVYKMIFANNAGVAGRYDQRYDTAVSYYMKALKIAEEENDLKNIAIAGNGIGNTLGNIPGRQDEALAYFERSLEAEKQRDNSLGVAMNYLSISDHYINKKEFVTARKYLDELLKINRERNDDYGLAITYEFYGKSYLEEGKDMERAANYFEDALNRFENLGDAHQQAQILGSLGDVHFNQGALAAARNYYERSLNLAKELNQHGLIMQNSYQLAEILERQNQPSAALQYLKQGKAYEDSIKLEEQNVEIAALIRQYDIEKKEDHIQLLEKDKALQQTLLDNQQQKLERRRILMILLGTGLLFILVIFLLQYRNHQMKKKVNARILEEEKAKMKAIYERNLARAEILVTRLRINPHFIFNSLNAITYLIQSQQNAKAMKYLVVFSRYTRMVLETSQKHVVPLSEELQLTQYYLTLEKNRFEKDFTFEIKGDDAPEISKFMIPPLLLQPLIENAIWHGLLPSKKEVKILLLEVIPEGEEVKIIIDDNGVGRTFTEKRSSEKEHKSMGMKILKERVELYNKSYSGHIDFEIIDKKDEAGNPEGTRIVFKLQQKIHSKNPAELLS
ncbi:tetratricopeptide repeat protein [Salinimicrobium tongyeongense]|uniref:Tetratricopeptide repeat protein n=1 Tax=Salinimicrobium tongyeongense TaxID=2809707 RepID=A0ABY6NTC3_9FLAO|nr:tetratricopeptide repeat protein [Salinimicrobium tongyeongense]UZH56164.1 tetratricopeptide repeat protein [Salinimicrobium tongyeongense]